MQRRRAVNLNSKCFYLFSLAPYTWPFSLLPIDTRSLAARALSPPQQQQQQQQQQQPFVAASASSAVFECRHGLLVVLLVLCDLALLLLCYLCDSYHRVVGMDLLHSSCRDHRAL